MMTTTNSKMLLALVCALALTSTALAENYCTTAGGCTTCKTVGDNQSCTECSGQFFASVVSGTTLECKAATKENCILQSSSGTCSICADNYSLNSGACTEVKNNKIDHCLRYKGADSAADIQCTHCAATFGPSADAKANKCETASGTGYSVNCAYNGGLKAAVVCAQCKSLYLIHI